MELIGRHRRYSICNALLDALVAQSCSSFVGYA